MKQGNGMLYELVDGAVWAALHVLTNQRFKLGSKTNFHDGILRHPPEIVVPESGA
jgi:hypothetical protein